MKDREEFLAKQKSEEGKETPTKVVENPLSKPKEKLLDEPRRYA